MSGDKHLAGPWHWHNGSIVQANGYIVANAVVQRPSARPTIDLRQEDAQLIACAPELLERLREMTEHYVKLAGCGDCGHWNPEMEDEVIAARAIIAKATGSP